VTPALPQYPSGSNRDCTELTVEADPQLVAQGWVRRHLADPARAEESIELYESMGYEVRAQKLSPADFGPGCSGCAPVVGSTCVLIYTRRKERAP
jgi:hypothetical protein